MPHVHPLKPGVLMLLHGGRGEGKTSLALELLLDAAEMNRESLYIYTDSLANLSRFASKPGSEKVRLKQLYDMEELIRILLEIRIRGAEIDVLAVDSLSDLYYTYIAEKGLIASLISTNAVMGLLRELTDVAGVAALVVARDKPSSGEPDPRILTYWPDVVVRAPEERI